VQYGVHAHKGMQIHAVTYATIGHQVFEIKIIQNSNKTNSDIRLRNMGAERNCNSETVSL